MCPPQVKERTKRKDRFKQMSRVNNEPLTLQGHGQAPAPPKLSSEEIVPVCKVLSGTYVIIPDPDLQEPFTQQLMSPLTNDQLQALQAQDEKCTSLIAMLGRGRLDPLVYSINDGILYRCVIEGGQTFQAIYVPRTPPGLIQSILKAAHDD